MRLSPIISSYWTLEYFICLSNEIFCYLKGGLKVEMPMNLKVNIEQTNGWLKSLDINL